jgi:murein DD-endopeptidase MepM/ murein hydrolase activator NlpD
MTRNKVYIFLLSAFLIQACSTVARKDFGSRGLLQGGGASKSSRGPVLEEETEGNEKVIPSEWVENSDDDKPIRLIWPLERGEVSSAFGKRRRDFHDGIDIRANRGTPIYAAQAGTVLYSSRRIRGYGNMIVIKHDSGFATIYAHNKKNFVKKGDRVIQGQQIALVGATGKATGPHVHFEVRRGEVPQNPLDYLPVNKSILVSKRENGNYRR